MRKLSIVIAFLFCAYIPAFSILEVGSDAPDFTLTDVNGVQHTLSEYTGQDFVVFIDFFSLSCGPCHDQSSYFENLYQNNKEK